MVPNRIESGNFIRKSKWLFINNSVVLVQMLDAGLILTFFLGRFVFL
jgi:hypothetical protein